MKTLYIVRHAKSSWSFDLPDADRPLGVRGRRDAPRVGKYLSDNERTPDLMLSSPASRALYTALIIADEWGYPEEEIVLAKGLYHTSSSELLEILKEQDDDKNTIAIFGHNPGFTDLANELGTEYLDNLPTSGVCAYEFDVDAWAEITSKNASRKFLVLPKRLPN